jgi:hypothetical protein
VKSTVTTTFRVLILVMLLAACGGGGGGGGSSGDPAEAVQNYLRASVVDNDADRTRDLTCAALESGAEGAALSWASVDAQLEGMTCERSGTNGDFTQITCQGQISAVYGAGETAETRTFPLGTYQVIEEEGQWRWCGEAAAPAPIQNFPTDEPVPAVEVTPEGTPQS